MNYSYSLYDLYSEDMFLNLKQNKLDDPEVRLLVDLERDVLQARHYIKDTATATFSEQFIFAFNFIDNARKTYFKVCCLAKGEIEIENTHFDHNAAMCTSIIANYFIIFDESLAFQLIQNFFKLIRLITVPLRKNLKIELSGFLETRKLSHIKIRNYMVGRSVLVRKKSKREIILDNLSSEINELESIKQRLAQLESTS